jgi:N-hydroxyarylamine O-acetyltransferase
LWVLQSLAKESWHDLFAFTLEPHYPVDYEVFNWYTSTHPTSWFVTSVVVQRPTPQARYTLCDRTLTIRRGDDETTHAIADDDALLRMLDETFGLTFPPGTRFQCPGSPQKACSGRSRPAS